VAPQYTTAGFWSNSPPVADAYYSSFRIHPTTLEKPQPIEILKIRLKAGKIAGSSYPLTK